MTLVLYALNRRYYLNEKGAFAESQEFPVVPAGFHSEVASVLGEQGGAAREMEQRAVRLKLLFDGERIRQIEAKALRKLRQTGRSRNLEGFMERE